MARKPCTLITGAAGFIGSHLCDRFLGEGHVVHAMDNLSTGRLENIEHLFGNADFHFYRHDVTEFIHVPGPLDYVLHFASPASPVDYHRLDVPTMKVNAMGTHKALGLAKEKKARFLLASTSEIYGDPLVHPQREDYFGNVNPIGPRGVYDESKRFAEALTTAYRKSEGVDARIARIFNTYGPRMRLEDGRALPAFIAAALKGEPISIFGDGTQTRSFCYVSDLVEGLWRLLLSGEPEPVNLGNPEEITILDFAKEILALTGGRSQIRFSPLPEGDPKVRRPDISKAKRVLGWEPKVHRRDGLLQTIPFFRKVLGLGPAPAAR